MAQRQPTRTSASENITPITTNWLTSPPRQFASPYPTWLNTLDRNIAAKQWAGFAARLAGNLEGVAREGADMVKGVTDAGAFATRLLDPTDAEHRPRGQAAWDQVARTAQASIDYGKQMASDPARLASDASAVFNHLYRSTSPAATPVAPSLMGEIQRSRQIGVNQGRVAAEIASVVGPGLLAKAPRALSVAEEIALYQARGEPLDVAQSLARRPYKGMGSHYVSRETGDDLYIPKALIDSMFNVHKPKNISYGKMYEEHFRYDPEFDGARLPKGLSKKGWSGRQAGLERYGPVERLLKGAPGPLKAAAGGAAALGYDTLGQEPDE